MEIAQRISETSGLVRYVVIENGRETGIYHATRVAAERFAHGLANPRKSRKVRGWSVQG